MTLDEFVARVEATLEPEMGATKWAANSMRTGGTASFGYAWRATGKNGDYEVRLWWANGIGTTDWIKGAHPTIASAARNQPVQLDEAGAESFARRIAAFLKDGTLLQT